MSSQYSVDRLVRLCAAAAAALASVGCDADAPTAAPSRTPEAPSAMLAVRPGKFDPQHPAGASAAFARQLLDLPDTITNRYIVVLKDNVPGGVVAAAEALVAAYGGHPKYVYQSALQGFAVYNLPDGALEKLRAHPLVKYVVASGTGRAATVQTYPVNYVGGSALDRIDQRPSLTSASPSYHYYRTAFTGAGVHIYIVDSGIRASHAEFKDALGASRIEQGAAFINFSNNPSAEIDAVGHGTEVAGVAAGLNYGVARDARIHSVRINDGGKTYVDDAAAGLDWVGRQKDANPSRLMVANLSYSFTVGGDVVRDALNKLASKGVPVVKAVGDYGGNSCDYADNRTNWGQVMRVTSSTIDDQRADYAPYGTCVDLFAPGDAYTSSNGNDADYRVKTGTSISAPLVTGVIAGILQEDPTANPMWIHTLLTYSATTGANFSPSNLSQSPQLLLYSWHTYMTWSTPIQSNGTLYSYEYPQTKTWQANPVGGDGTYSYVWETSYNNGSWQVVSNARTYSRTINANERGTLKVRVTVTTNTWTTETMSLSATYYIAPYVEPTCQPGVMC